MTADSITRKLRVQVCFMYRIFTENMYRRQIKHLLVHSTVKERDGEFQWSARGTPATERKETGCKKQH